MTDSAIARVPMPARIGVGAGLVVVFAAAYYVVFFSEVQSQIEGAINQRSALERDLQTAKKAEMAYQKDLEELARRRERERELNKILPPTTEYPAFLSAVQTVANSTGVELTAWSPQAEVKEEYYARVPMKLEVQGRFHQIAKFFYGIGQNDRIMNMENISMKSPTVHDNEIYLKVTGLATAFRALDTKDAPAAGSAGQSRRDRKGG